MSRYTWFSAFFAAVLLFLVSGPAHAELKVATVDFQRALNEVQEGAKQMARLEGIRDEKMKSLEKKKQSLIQMQSELQSQAALLSESARKEKEQNFLQAQAELQQAAAASEQEFQQTYMGVLDELMQKMKDTAAQMGRDKGYNLILESSQGGVVFASGIPDLTDDLIKVYNAAHPSAAGK